MSQAVPVYDLVGVGFGPSNLALAIALTEHNAVSRHKTTGVFLERQPRFGWHRGMLIDDATMQVSFLKDLVTGLQERLEGAVPPGLVPEHRDPHG